MNMFIKGDKIVVKKNIQLHRLKDKVSTVLSCIHISQTLYVLTIEEDYYIYNPINFELANNRKERINKLKL